MIIKQTIIRKPGWMEDSRWPTESEAIKRKQEVRVMGRHWGVIIEDTKVKPEYAEGKPCFVVYAKIKGFEEEIESKK